MREAGRIVASALVAMREMVAPGVTTADLDRRAEQVIRDMGAVPSFKGYHGFPGTVCASINEEIVHGIPGDRMLELGDLISVDVGAIWQGYQGDAALSAVVGEASDLQRRLMEATREALAAGIAAAREGNRLGDISNAVETAAVERGFRPVREYGGHGIGKAMHEPPNIPNSGPAGQGVRLSMGMTLAIEPMLTAGDDHTTVLSDGWTVITADRSLSAHFEHTIVITENGAEILTKV